MRGRVLLAALALVLCAQPAAAREAADIEGTVTRAESGIILVEERPGERSGSAKALVEITGGTEVRFGGTGAPASPDALTVGRRVAVGFEGPVAESYPVQAEAVYVEILGGRELPRTGGGYGMPALWALAAAVPVAAFGLAWAARPRG